MSDKIKPDFNISVLLDAIGDDKLKEELANLEPLPRYTDCYDKFNAEGGGEDEQQEEYYASGEENDG